LARVVFASYVGDVQVCSVEPHVGQVSRPRSSRRSRSAFVVEPRLQRRSTHAAFVSVQSVSETIAGTVTPTPLARSRR
jgi:hypothetical protein